MKNERPPIFTLDNFLGLALGLACIYGLIQWALWSWELLSTATMEYGPNQPHPFEVAIALMPFALLAFFGLIGLGWIVTLFLPSEDADNE